MNLKVTGQNFDERYISYAELGLTPSASGTIWGIGRNSPQGMLGLGDTTNRSVFTQVGTNRWVNVGCTSLSSFAVRGDGTLWAWGGNGLTYDLGLGDTAMRSSPVQVGSATTWVKVDGGYNASGGYGLALRRDGTLWGWGVNAEGQLGLGSISVGVSAPTQVGSATHIDVSAGATHSLVIRSNGTIWASGSNEWGQLGDASTTNRSVHSQVASGTWVQVSASNATSYAIRQDGSLWAWGINEFGALGLNDRIHRSVPTRIGTDTWKQVQALGNAVFAIKSNGTLWSWGLNSNSYLLGLGDTVHRSSPVQVGALSSWQQLSPSHDTVIAAIRTDGTLWSNFSATGGYPSQHTPPGLVQLGTDSDWVSAAAGQTHIIAIKG
jgi:alpha-tubulin suppressor-like RCC1 family protein